MIHWTKLKNLYLKVLTRFNMEYPKRGFFGVQHGLSLNNTKCPSKNNEIKQMSSVPYVSAIGSNMYAMICTGPDVSYALSICSIFQSNPSESH